MAYDYIVLVRNDMAGNSIQLTDLFPNTSQRNYVLDGHGQTGYLGELVQNQTVATTTGAGNTILTTTAAGVAAYLLDNVMDGASSDVLSAAAANGAALQLIAMVAAGVPMNSPTTLTDALVAGGAGAGTLLSSLTPLSSGSTGVVEELLRIMAGETYQVAAGIIGPTVFAAPHVRVGSFVSGTEVVNGPSFNYGQLPIGQSIVKTPAPFVLGNPAFVNVRRFVDTGALHLSAAAGNLSHFISPAYQFINSEFNYPVSVSAKITFLSTGAVADTIRIGTTSAADGVTAVTFTAAASAVPTTLTFEDATDAGSGAAAAASFVAVANAATAQAAFAALLGNGQTITASATGAIVTLTVTGSLYRASPLALAAPVGTAHYTLSGATFTVLSAPLVEGVPALQLATNLPLATNIDGTCVGAGGVGPALVIYSNLGALITN